MRHLRYYPLFAALLPYACQSDFALPEATSSGFVVVGTANSGLEFNNLITESDSFNYFTYPYLFLGAGVAAGDFDGDGATDLFFTGNQVANRLYRNLGNLQFEDVTEVAGVAAPNNWCTGVTTLDVNTDGHLDLYVATAGAGAPTANLLYVNQGDGTFVEQAAAYGLAEKNHSIQATAFDFDLDGDQDLFVANYANVPVSQGNEFYDRKMRENNPAESGQLYRNNGDGTFTNHTDAAGLRRFGLTLGLIATDFNADGHTDLYLSNDFNVPDYFFLNQGDGTFREALASSFPHTAMFGMGIDAGDINNDGHPDLIQLDMTPADYRKAKTNMASMRPASFYRAVSLGFHYQYMQNALQLHRGVDVNGTPHFTDISRFSGTATTDWSWGALLEDLDNDGFQDLFVTNGMKRDVNDNDVNASYNEGNFFSDNKSRDYRLLPSHPVGNFAFRNQGDLLMEDVSERWRANQAGFSQGFIAADLDGDGDLELAINNIDAPVLLLENRLGGSFLSVNLEGPAENPLGLNANVTIWQGSKSQSKELTLTRGYLSAQPPQLHFGLREGAVDSIVVNWSDRYKSVVKNVRPNNKISIVWSAQEFATSSSTQPKFFELPNALVPHQEDNYDDFLVEPLLPHRYSRLGPIPAVSANYLYLPGAAGEAGTLYQTSTVGATAGATTVASARENFTAKLLGKPNAAYAGREEVSALFFDMDGDGDDDLYVVHGGNNAKATPDSFQDVLYRNDGGGFVETTLPSMHSSGQVVSAADYDADGDQDLFIGGRIVPGAYPQPAQSYLLENDGNGVFIDVTEPLAPELSKAGLITTAAWADFNGDARLDLAVTGEWMGVEIWLQTAAGFTKMETPAAPSGWWYALAAKDLDGDDDLDLLVGNLGRNYKYQADESHRFEVYANDFDENGHNDIVLAKAGEEGHRLPLRGRECSSEQIPAIAQRFETYAAFADADLEDIYGAQMLNTSLHYAVEEFGHHWLENQGDATFVPHLLPASTQLSSINAIEEIDYNQDEHSDYLLAGNLLYAEVETPRNDGGYGIVLLGGSEGPAGVVRPEESGFFLEGEIRAITTLRQGRKTYLMIARNNAPWQIFNEAP